MKSMLKHKRKIILAGVIVLSFQTSLLFAVTSKITRHVSGADLIKGQTKDVVVSSRGTVQLGQAAETIVEEFKDVWSINAIVVDGPRIFIGTSPNGGIYSYSFGKIVELYPGEQESPKKSQETAEPNDVNEICDADIVKQQEHLKNEHIFAMATDLSGRLLAGISGEKCRLMRLEADKMKTIFEPNEDSNETRYIFAIALDKKGDIYLGTGPEGKIFRLDSFGKEAELFYDSPDKNILSLAIGADGFVYAGSDSRGLVYKIHPRTQKASILYDTSQDEVTALLVTAGGEIYAAATSAKIVKTQTTFASQKPSSGRPEIQLKSEKKSGQKKSGIKLQIPNTKKSQASKTGGTKPSAPKLSKPGKASHIYKISKDGYVTDVFSEVAVFYCLAKQNQNLLVGTGNNAQLFMVETELEQEKIIYADEQASQITCAVVAGNDVYIGTANPAKLVKLSSKYAGVGTYTSTLIDAGQPAKWGKLQIEAEIPKGCKIKTASRSGNVGDVNDPTFSDWTDVVEITKPVQLRCPSGRFCQYKLVLESGLGSETPIVREVAIAHTIPNLSPKVETVSVNRTEVKTKHGMFKVSFKATDENDDKLVYRIDFRKVGRDKWIKLEDELEASTFEWDGKTVEDGRYEIKITASDERSNTTETKLSGSRISDYVVVDNTGPEFSNVDSKISRKKDKIEVVLKFKLVDELSSIGSLEYTVDSNADWIGSVPLDLVYDTTVEVFKVLIEDLSDGEHLVALKAVDVVGNVTYKTFEINGLGD